MKLHQTTAIKDVKITDKHLRQCNVKKFWRPIASIAVMMAISLSGCERKETIVEIKTPGGQIEVERSVDSGAVEVQVRDKD